MNNTNRLLKCALLLSPSVDLLAVLTSLDLFTRSSKTLESSQRIISETEEIGISVMDSLAQQRESLLSAHEKVIRFLNSSDCFCMNSSVLIASTGARHKREYK